MTNVHMKFSLGIIISIVPKPGTCTRRWNCPRARNLNQRSGWLESKPGLRGQPVRGSRPLQFVWRGLAKPVLPSRESEFRLRLLLLLLLLSMLLHLWSTLLLLMDQLLWLLTIVLLLLIRLRLCRLVLKTKKAPRGLINK